MPFSEGMCSDNVFARAFRNGHVHVSICTWGMCLENPKCTGDIYGVRKNKYRVGR